MASRATRKRLDVGRLDVTCESGKIGYATKARAIDGAESAMTAGKVEPGCHVMPYLCWDCGQWHIRNHTIRFTPE